MAAAENVAVVLVVAFRYVVNEANIEAGYERVRDLSGGVLDEDGVRTAIAECLRDGLIREPIRLPEGALQCHWQLELTPAGLAAARVLGKRSS